MRRPTDRVSSVSSAQLAGGPDAHAAHMSTPGHPLHDYVAEVSERTEVRRGYSVTQSGLLRIFETSSDMRDLLDRETQDVRAAEAVVLLCYQVKKGIGAFAAVLGGLDQLVFAGGIGENAPPVRVRICEGLRFLGVELDETHNAGHEGVISPAGGRVAARVIHTDEELMTARSVCRALGLGLASETMNSEHATTYSARLDPCSESRVSP